MRTRIAPVLLALALAPCLPALGAQRAFVASFGNDANAASGCTLAAPCRGFQAAHTAVDAAGEIVALDTAGYGAITISKSVTIMSNPGVVAGITVSAGQGVTIATPGVAVILRGLNLNNVGTGTYGIRMTDGSSLAIENCVVSRFANGVRVETAARVKVIDSLVRGGDVALAIANGATADVVGSQFLASGYGFSAEGGAAGTVTTASISDSVASDNIYGFRALNVNANSTVRLSCTRCTASNNSLTAFLAGADPTATSVMVVSGSMATFNGQVGFFHPALGGTSTFASLGNNTLYANAGGDTSGTIATIPGK